MLCYVMMCSHTRLYVCIDGYLKEATTPQRVNREIDFQVMVVKESSEFTSSLTRTFQKKRVIQLKKII